MMNSDTSKSKWKVTYYDGFDYDSPITREMFVTADSYLFAIIEALYILGPEFCFSNPLKGIISVEKI